MKGAISELCHCVLHKEATSRHVDTKDMLYYSLMDFVRTVQCLVELWQAEDPE